MHSITSCRFADSDNGLNIQICCGKAAITQIPGFIGKGGVQGAFVLF